MFKEKVFKFQEKFDIEKSIGETVNLINDSYYICNLSDVVQKYDDWIKHMPRVHPHYAVKCNDDIKVLKTLASIGCSFDCATLWEMKQILSLNVDAERIIYANTTKIKSHIEYAKNHNVTTMTFDNEDEIGKISAIYPQAK